MDDSTKYLIHVTIAADGVVERSDVVGAIFGQTEGLLGDELDLRDLQQSSKVGRIDVDIDSENGQSYGEVTIASSLDKVKTSVLAASLETISRVGPCKASLEVTDIEDVRAAKRREVVERAKELLTQSFDGESMTSEEIVEQVRQSVRVEDVAEYAGLPAGPRIEESDAIIVVEGRADVLTLLRYGIKNAIAVEGTNVPDAVADLSQERTVTAFLDGDRGGELILRELSQVGDVDFVVFAPEDQSVEDLDQHEVMAALRGKVPFDQLPEEGNLRDAVAETTTHGLESPEAAPVSDTTDTIESALSETGTRSEQVTVQPVDTATVEESPESTAPTTAEPDQTDAAAENGQRAVDSDQSTATSEQPPAESQQEPAAEPPTSLRGHVEAIIGDETGHARLLDRDLDRLSDVPIDEAFDALEGHDPVPYAIILDGTLPQRVLDVAAQRGVEHVIARETGEYVKKPVSVRIRTAEQLLAGQSS